MKWSQPSETTWTSGRFTIRAIPLPPRGKKLTYELSEDDGFVGDYDSVDEAQANARDMDADRVDRAEHEAAEREEARAERARELEYDRREEQGLDRWRGIE